MNEERLLSMSDLVEMLGVSRCTIYRMLNDGASKFPKPVVIGKRKRWVLKEIIAWINSRGDAPGTRSEENA